MMKNGFLLIAALICVVSAAAQRYRSEAGLPGAQTLASSVLRSCDRFAGSDGGTKIAACLENLPDRGVADARAIEGTQAISNDVFAGIQTRGTLLLGPALYISSSNLTIPENLTVVFSSQTSVALEAEKVLTVHGQVEAGLHPIFSGQGRVVFDDTSTGPLYPQWWGAKGDGRNDDTQAISSMIASISGTGSMVFPAGKYLVTTVTFPNDHTFSVRFDGGARIIGGATTRTDCIVRIKTVSSTFSNLEVDGNFNNNYSAAVWWYDADKASQYNTIFGMRIIYSRRGMIYGELPGKTSTNLAQSENSVSGWRTRGVQNPFFGNHVNGGLFFANAMFIAFNEEWPDRAAFDWNDSRAFENHRGNVVVNGGELVKAASNLGYAADVGATTVFIGMIVETVAPIRIVSATEDGGPRFSNSRFLVGQDSVSQFYIQKGIPGVVNLVASGFYRAPGVGSYSAISLVDASDADGSFETRISDSTIEEWRWDLVSGGDVRPVAGGVPYYSNVRFRQTAGTPVFLVDNVRAFNLFEKQSVDVLQYTTRGWHVHKDSGDSKIAVSGDGPEGYQSSLSVLSSGKTSVTNIDPSRGIETIAMSGFQVRHNEKYMVGGWVKHVSSEGNPTVALVARFYDISGAYLSTSVISNVAVQKGMKWAHHYAPIVVPPGAAFMGVGIECIGAEARFTDLRLTRAD